MLTSPSFAGGPSGFSLIEVMVALAIFAIAMMLGAPSFTIAMKNAQVRTVTESIQNGLQVARNEALRRNGPVEFALDTDTGWTITTRIPNTKDAAVQQRPKGEGSSANVSATLSPVGASVVFDGLGRVVNAAPLAQVDVASAVAGTHKLRVQVSSGGQIRMCNPDPDIPSSDPRYCL